MAESQTTPPAFLRSVANADGTLEGTIQEEDGYGYIALPCDRGLILLDGEWTPAQLRAIADYAESIGVPNDE